MTESDPNKALKTMVDTFSAMSIIYALIVLPWWCYFDPAFHNHIPQGEKWPIQVKIFFVDAIPFAFGIIWLAFRYAKTIVGKWPFVRTTQFRVLSMAVGLAYGIFYNILLHAK
jgi:hypothetical protein